MFHKDGDFITNIQIKKKKHDKNDSNLIETL